MTNYRKLLEAKRDELHAPGFNHPCMNTCSGWKQGYEKGFNTLMEKAIELAEALEAIKNCEYNQDDKQRMIGIASKYLNNFTNWLEGK